ncbi:unnamed protein product [Symbiodinium sp. CCMP2592]|nr:unnamed protein product [Symbiodinium sp. CCMP2592]
MRSVYNMEDGRDLTLVGEGRVDSTARFKLSLKFPKGAVRTAQAVASATARRPRYMDRTASNHPTLQKTEPRRQPRLTPASPQAMVLPVPLQLRVSLQEA